MTRNEIADELMRDVPSEARKDHAAMADAIRRGDTREQILAMREADRWPETYVWLRATLDAHIMSADAAEKMYMNIATGSVDTRDGWWYEDENGEQVNAVDREEVVEVVSDGDGGWVEVV